MTRIGSTALASLRVRMLLVALLTWPAINVLASDSVLQSLGCQYEHCLIVNSSNPNGPWTLSWALAEASRYKSSVEIQLANGTFILSDNAVTTFQEWNDFSMTGQGIHETVIKCSSENIGIFFNASKNLAFSSLSMSGCGRVFNTTSIGPGPASPYLLSKTGMLFNSCSSLTFKDFRIYGCYGTAITIYNTNGNNLFLRCQVKKNYLNGDDPLTGGGGVTIETSHCSPGDSDCQDGSSEVEATKDSSYLFKHCEINYNKAMAPSTVFSGTYPHGKSHMALGNGGGLAIILKGRTYNNFVKIESCNFLGNNAKWGGAIYFSFGDISVNNSVVITDSLFQGNNFEYNKMNTSTGGAVRITMISYPQDRDLWGDYVSDVTGNSINFTDTRFLQNFASWGGAVSFSTTRNIRQQDLSNSLLFVRCQFLQNRANLLASAMDISTWKPDVIEGKKEYLVPVFEDCTFCLNTIEFHNISSYPIGIGALYVQGLSSIFLGTNTFCGNSGTALVVADTYILIMKSSIMNFTDNSGQRGGALAFFGNSWMIVQKDTYILFDGNSVGPFGLGGAIYSVHFGESNLLLQQNCFFQYHKFTEPPSKWNATFVFRGNTADNLVNSIYTTSIAPCIWSHLGGQDDVAESGAFCDYSTWRFEGVGRNCHNEIATGPGRISVKRSMDVIPGWKANLGVQTFDDFDRFVPTVLVASASQGNISISNKTTYIADGNIVINGMENSEQNNLLLMTLDPRVVASVVRVHVKKCPVGFQSFGCKSPHAVGQTCNCVCNKKTQGLSCSNITKQVTLFQFNCATLVSNESDLLAVARCPYNKRMNFVLTNISSNLSEQVCGSYNRKGYLCSDCIEGYGVAFNRYDYGCVPCKEHKKYAWVFFILIELGPITIACILVILFGVRLVSPSMNAFVFFSQVVSIRYFHNYNCWFFGADHINPSLSTPVFFLYGIWNLDFFRNIIHGVCLHEGLNTLQILVINYVMAFYPMLVLMISFICIKLYDRNVRFVRFLWKPFKYCFKVLHCDHSPTTSIIGAFTSLIVLSYTKVMYVSFPLAAVESVHQTWGNGSVTTLLSHHYYFHLSASLDRSSDLIYFILGVASLIIFVALPPIFLILYSFPFIKSRIGRFNPRLQITLGTFADSFLGAFRDGTDGDRNCRWFGGVYFLFRIVFFVIYVNQLPWMNQYLIQQIVCTLIIALFAIVRPYRIDFYNYLDISFFTLLAILNSMSFFNSQHAFMQKPINTKVFNANYVLIFLPILYLIFFLVYRILLWSGIFQKLGMLRKSREYVHISEDMSEEERPYGSEIELPYDDDEVLPDRMVHPNLYKSLSQISSMNSRGSAGSSRDKSNKHHLLPSNGAATAEPASKVPKASVLLEHEWATAP